MPASLDSSRPIMAPSVSHSQFSHLKMSAPVDLSKPAAPASASHLSTHSHPRSLSHSAPPRLSVQGLTVTLPPQVRTSVRYSTYSMTPSFTPTVRTGDSAHAEIRDIATGLDRMENKALSQQRVVLTEEKSANMSKLALGAKLERALGRRMSGQDAVMRPRKKVLSEKRNS